MRLHLPSLAIGLAAVAVVFVSMSQSVPGTNSPRIEYGPHPRDMIQIKEGTPYTVPAPYIFVLTALGVTTQGPTCYLKVNGQTEAVSYVGSPYAGGSEMVAMPTGFTVPAGATIEVAVQGGGSSGYGRAWGYLAK